MRSNTVVCEVIEILIKAYVKLTVQGKFHIGNILKY